MTTESLSVLDTICGCGIIAEIILDIDDEILEELKRKSLENKVRLNDLIEKYILYRIKKRG